MIENEMHQSHRKLVVKEGRKESGADSRAESRADFFFF